MGDHSQSDSVLQTDEGPSCEFDYMDWVGGNVDSVRFLPSGEQSREARTHMRRLREGATVQ